MRVAARVTAVVLLAACREAPAELGPDLTDRRSAVPLPAQWSFSGRPAAPLPFDEPGWDVQVHSRDRETWRTPQPMAAQHAGDCGPPPATHAVTRAEELVFRCRDHLMTAINASGYGALVLTPDRLLDWSAGEAVVRFDLSTLRTSTRDWVALWLTPWDQQLAVPAEEFAPDLNGLPANGVVIEMSANGNFCARVVRSFTPRALPCTDWRPLSAVLTPSATARTTFEVRISRSRVRVTAPTIGVTFVDAPVSPALTYTQALVQFAHYSYTPTKCDGCTGPNTWHWDEVHASPSVPFTLVRGDRRYVDGAGGVVTLRAPAPANARLRFVAQGVEPDVSFDNGVTWRRPQAQRAARTNDPVRQYWTPIPAGTRTVRLRPGRVITWWPDRSDWMAKDFGVFAR